MAANDELPESPYIPPGDYERRVVALQFDLSGWTQVTCGEVYDG